MFSFYTPSGTDPMNDGCPTDDACMMHCMCTYIAHTNWNFPKGFFPGNCKIGARKRALAMSNSLRGRLQLTSSFPSFLLFPITLVVFFSREVLQREDQRCDTSSFAVFFEKYSEGRHQTVYSWISCRFFFVLGEFFRYSIPKTKIRTDCKKIVFGVQFWFIVLPNILTSCIVKFLNHQQSVQLVTSVSI